MALLEHIDREVAHVETQLRRAIESTRNWLDEVERGIARGHAGGINVMVDHDVWRESGRLQVLYDLRERALAAAETCPECNTAPHLVGCPLRVDNTPAIKKG